jgi:hypothetical protein
MFCSDVQTATIKGFLCVIPAAMRRKSDGHSNYSAGGFAQRMPVVMDDGHHAANLEQKILGLDCKGSASPGLISRGCSINTQPVSSVSVAQCKTLPNRVNSNSEIS